MTHNNNDNSTLLSPCPDNGKFAKVFVLAVLTEPAALQWFKCTNEWCPVCQRFLRRTYYPLYSQLHQAILENYYAIQYLYMLQYKKIV